MNRPSPAGNATAALSDKLRDLALLQEALDALSAQSGADPAGRLDVLAAQLPDCTWLRGAKFYIDGFTDFTAQELYGAELGAEACQLNMITTVCCLFTVPIVSLFL